MQSAMASESPIFQPSRADTAATFRALIQQLSTLRAPDQIQKCQAEIIELQKGQYAYDLAFKLQHDAGDDTNLHFFAALTLAIKINQDPAPTEAEARLLLPELLNWLIEAVNRRRPPVVQRRISTTLVTLFCVPSTSWTNCITHVATALATGNAAIDETSLPDISNVAARCDSHHVDALFGFCVILAEQLRDIAHNTTYDNVHKRAISNIRPLFEILKRFYATSALASGPALPLCHLQWLKYAKSSKAPFEDCHSLSSLLTPAMKLMSNSSEADERFEALCRLLEKSFKDESIDIRKEEMDSFTALLHGDVSRRIFSHLETGSVQEDGVAAFAIMVLAFCKRQTRKAFAPGELAALDGADKRPTSYFSGVRQEVRELVQRVTMPIVSPDCDERMAFAVVEFWEDFVQDTRSHTLRGEAQAFFLSAMNVLCLASQLSDLSDTVYDNEDDDDFRDELRSRVRDLLQVAYEEYGMPVTRGLVELIQTSAMKCMQQNDVPSWKELETTLFFLNEISDSFHFSPEADDAADEDQAIGTIFAADWFGVILDLQNDIPKIIRTSALATISAFSGFFGRHTEALWAAMDAMINCLLHPRFTAVTTRKLKTLCAENRRVIAKAQQQPRLYQVTSSFFSLDSSISTHLREDVLAMSATVAQALPPEQQLDAVTLLLDLVLREHEQKVYQTRHIPEMLTSIASDSLRLLNSLAVSLQSLDDSSGSDDEDEDTRSEASRARALWNSDEGQAMHKRIITDFENYVRTGDAYEEQLDSACNVLRAGYREHCPGPFVFSQDVSVGFIASMPLAHPQYRAVVDLAYDFIASHTSQSVRQDENIKTLTMKMIAAMRHQSSPSNDPDLSVKLLATVTRASSACTKIILQLPPEDLQHLLDFSFGCLQSPESLLKRGAAEFWSSFTGALSKPASPTLDPVQLNTFVRQFGPQLVACLAANYAGGAARSDLDRLVEPLRGLAVRMTSDTRSWLEQAIDDPAFDGGRSSAVQKRQFIGSVAMLRGNVKTRAAVKDFWFACRGVAAGYG